MSGFDMEFGPSPIRKIDTGKYFSAPKLFEYIPNLAKNPVGAISKVAGNPVGAISKVAGNPLSAQIGKLGLGKAGMFGVPYLGTALAIGGALGLGKLFGRRRGPSQQQIAMDNLSRQMEGQSQAMAGYLGGLGRSMTTSGLAARDLGRSRALSALTDPNIRRMQEASLASNLGSQRAAIGPMVGMLGGGLAGSRYARGMSQFDPAMAQGLVGIGQNALANRAQAGNMLAGYGQQDIGQGLGLEQAGHQLGQGGQAQRMAYMRDRQNFDAQQAARRQGMLAQVAGLAARGATGGLFG